MAYQKHDTRPKPKHPKRDVNGKTWQHDMFEVTEKLIEVEQQFRTCENLAPATIKIRNLHHNVSAQDLNDLFSIIGRLKDVRIDFDRTGRSLGVANIRFERKVDAVEAISQYNGRELDGKALNIQLCRFDTDQYPRQNLRNRRPQLRNNFF